MSAQLDTTESNVLTVLRAFLLNILPTPIEVVQGQDNVVSEPTTNDFVVMTPTTRNRIETNIDTAADVLFTGSIAGAILTVTAVAYGALKVGSPVFGVNVAANTQIIALSSGTGGAGTYTVNNSQTISSETLAAGFQAALQPTETTIQLDVHGPNSTDNAQRITTLFRDGYAVDFFSTYPYAVVPLYTNNRGQQPFINGEDQYENRWVLDAVMQVNATVSTGLQYADKLVVADIYSVDVEFPPEAS